MIQTCNEEYWRGMESLKPSSGEAPCGRTFDDFDHMTYCPHPPFAGPTRGEIEARQQAASDEARAAHVARFGTRTRTRTRDV